MCSSVSPPSSLFLPNNTHFLYHRGNVSVPNSSHSILISVRSRNPKSSLSASVAEKNLEVSWFSTERSTVDDYGGWAIVEAPIQNKKKKGLPLFLLVGIGTSIAVLLATIAHFSLSRRGFRFQITNPFHSLHGMLMPSGANEAVESKYTDSDASNRNTMVSDASLESVMDLVDETVASETNHIKMQEGKLRHILIPVAPDSTQQEALLMLKKLKIIEDDVKADELCTRREYARWLVRAYSLLERNPKHRLVPAVSLCGSTSAAFDDVNVEDPDFRSIQSLAEAGIILSNLSGKNLSSHLDDIEGQEGVNFFPERFISRQDLISWKAQVEYEAVPGIIEKISRINMGFIDTRKISSDASPELFMDILAGDKSILRKVFGQGRRFQPNKPSTKAQAAVALMSGRMTALIHSELLRLEAENFLKKNAMDEIRSELLDRGDIPRYWNGKLEDERTRGCEVERAHLAAVHEFEQEKIVQENTLAEYLKEKAALDCQKHLLFSLKEEVNEMSERLECERAKYMDERHNLQDMLSDLQMKQEALLDAKSILEAEIEALRILKSWIEDEARKSQARAKVLEEVGRRWKWDDQA
ncbi:uncharacterized protein LOC132294692 [Cornus florida]|uniref:uncharacterized protein LOC132294692 n=1 Tax=Cornus florida TaxID=4283 RepID=UPI0028A154E0|nr:uncharacterized protein LOC132294692 [Cornus florida]